MNKNYQINDKRSIEYFKKTTFCGYKKTKVVDALKKSMLIGDIEKSTLWATELHISGYTKVLYDIILQTYIKDINTANIQLLPIIYYDYMKIQNSKVKKNLFLRNHQYTRNHIHNLIAYLTFSPKSKLNKVPKIKPDDFNIQVMKKHMISTNRSVIEPFISVYDNKNIIIPILEIYTNIIQKNNAKSLDNALYWLSWLCTYEKKFHKGYVLCYSRVNSRIHEKESKDFIWIIWNILFELAKKDKYKRKYLTYLFNIFTKNYKHTQKTKKIHLIILALTIMIDPHPHIQYNKKIISEKNNQTRIKILSNINYQYIDIQNNTPDNLYEIVKEQHKQFKQSTMKVKAEEQTDSIFSTNTKPYIPVDLDRVIRNIDARRGIHSKKEKEEKEKKEQQYTQTSMEKHIIELPKQTPEQSIFTKKKKYQKKHIHNFNKIFSYM